MKNFLGTPYRECFVYAVPFLSRRSYSGIKSEYKRSFEKVDRVGLKKEQNAGEASAGTLPA